MEYTGSKIRILSISSTFILLKQRFLYYYFIFSMSAACIVMSPFFLLIMVTCVLFCFFLSPILPETFQFCFGFFIFTRINLWHFLLSLLYVSFLLLNSALVFIIIFFLFVLFCDYFSNFLELIFSSLNFRLPSFLMSAFSFKYYFK